MNLVVGRRRFLQASAAFGVAFGSYSTGRFTVWPRKPTRAFCMASGWVGGWAVAPYSFRTLTFHETVAKVASLGLKQVVGFNWQKLDPKRSTRFFAKR